MTTVLQRSALANKRVLITGADGMLGRAFQAVLASTYPSTVVVARTRQQLDVTLRDQVLAEQVAQVDAIIHCAADVNADRCEVMAQQCHAIQVNGTRNVIDLAKACNATMFYPQSFLIYGESAGDVDENTPPDPKSTYARCKLEAERLLASSGVRSLVVRMGGFFGGEERDKNFVGTFTRRIQALLNEGVDTYGVGTRVWQPTFTEDLARNSLLLMDSAQSGVWCMSCDGHASFHELACHCIRVLKLDRQMKIAPIDAHAVETPDMAYRPNRVTMSNSKLKQAGLYGQRRWQDAVAEYLSRPWFQSLFRPFLENKVS
jgi:dTDP-4-dehydrorhamnose reductase